MAEIGERAPNFALPTDDGRTVSLKDFAGRWLVIFFYPRDDTSGCTREAIAFSELLPRFEEAGAAVLGISKDSVESHAKFRSKHGLTVPLASDADGTASEDYGVWKEKSMYGRKFYGIERSTFLIDPEGIIRRVWRKVKVPGHAEEVLAALKEETGAA